ncbi:MAG TPA: CDP-diacylglycerol--glycerol-3-phosphate 3-phosphatidyltransferase [Desulfobacteraceae bacterium]|nr:CDP-diacylglycerol--glycerol-3-phosphate 3-phosphatidyltransferase [Desulfobacteraceae bacterium]
MSIKTITPADLFNSEKLKNLLSDPNSLTLFRIAAAPGIVVLLFFPNRICTFLAAILFSAAAITDYFDGYFARQRGMTSAFGKAMDPLADKLLISSSLIMLASLGWIPGWVVCVIIARELAITGLRGMISDKGADVSASNLGKYKTGFQIAAIIPLIFHFPYFGVNLHAIGMFFLWGALIFSLWSGIDYLIRFGKLIDI